MVYHKFGGAPGVGGLVERGLRLRHIGRTSDCGGFFLFESVVTH
jgi:hypothetical protein